jgi:hypothetical protein
MNLTRHCGISATGSATLVLTLLLALAPCAGFAQTFTLKQALDYPFPYGLTTATHSNRIAWVFNVQGARNAWIADGPAFNARQVTHYSGDDGMPMASLRLTPDGTTVVYARGSETNAQGEVADPDSGNPLSRYGLPT